MDITSFDELLLAARQQEQPQRLLLVFVGASLPADATPAQRTAFEAGESGALAPLMCVDKDAAALRDFAELVEEAHALAPDWALVFAAALSGVAGQAPSEAVVQVALQRLVESVKSGQLAGLIPFDRQGAAVRLN